MPVELTAKEISRKYDRFARWYDLIEGIPDFLGVKKLRQRLLERASGQVLEVAVGTGKNFRFYPSVDRLIALDLSEGMLRRAQAKRRLSASNIALLVGDGERLPFEDRGFDTVVSTLTLCTFPDPLAALKEMARVCRPGGRVLLLEHGRSDREWLGRWQDRRADRQAKQLGCHWNREPLELVREAGLTVVRARRVFLGIFHRIEAEPRPA